MCSFNVGGSSNGDELVSAKLGVSNDAACEHGSMLAPAIGAQGAIVAVSSWACGGSSCPKLQPAVSATVSRKMVIVFFAVDTLCCTCDW